MTDSPLATAHRLLDEATAALTAAGAGASDDELLSALTMCEGVTRRLDQLTVSTVSALQRHDPSRTSPPEPDRRPTRPPPGRNICARLRDTARMRMQFDPEAEDAFLARRDELGERFAQWLNAQRVPGDPGDAGLLMDWKWGYADGALDRWTVPDVREFLFEWCPRKLSAAPAHCAEIPRSVAAFVEFLAHTGRLGRGGDPPSRIRKYCEGNASAFVREMGNPANFGMAKGLFGAAGTREEVTAVLRRLEGEASGAVGLGRAEAADEAELLVVGPVRLPTDDERLAAVRATAVIRQVRMLAGYCAAPGRALTSSGMLRLADARHLVDLLETGDDVRGLRSADDLPALSRVVDLALLAGAVRRRRGRLVAVGRFAALDEVAAYEQVLRAGLTSHPGDDYTAEVLLELLDSDGGVAVKALVEALSGVLSEAAGGVDGFLLEIVAGQVVDELDQLADLGVVTLTGVDEPCPDCGTRHGLDGHAALTVAAAPVVVALLREAGVEVVVRSDPATADAAAIADLVGLVEESEWRRDASTWLAAQPDPVVAGHALVGEIASGDRGTAVVLAGLEAVADVLGDGAADAVRAQLGGPHDGLVLHWLVARSEVDPASVDPARHLGGLLDVLAAVLDAAEPADLVAMLGTGPSAEHLALLDAIWRVDHPRLPDVLDALGRHHPIKAVAKAARKALVRYRSRRANRADDNPF